MADKHSKLESDKTEIFEEPEESGEDLFETEGLEGLDELGLDDESELDEQEEPEEIEQPLVAEEAGSKLDFPEGSEPLEEVSGAVLKPEQAAALSDDLPIKLSAVLGKKEMSLKDLLELKSGQVVNLKRPPNEIVDLVVGGKVVGKGELVEIDGALGVRIVQLLK